MKIEIRPEWLLKKQDGSAISLPLLLRILTEVRNQNSITGAATAIGLSYRHAWGLLREFESQFGAALVQKVRGQGTVLTALAEKMIWADKRIAARLSPLLDSLASELEQELAALLTNRYSALRITASHGFAVDAMMHQLQEENFPVDLKYRSSEEALISLARGECDLAGFHLPVGEFHQTAAAHYFKWLNSKQHALIHLAYRHQGLFIAKGNPKQIADMSDLVRPDVRFVNRQTGSGTRMLLELFLKKHGINNSDIAGYETAELTHAAIAAYVASGMADVGFGIETAARKFDLDFIPIVREQYFFASTQAALAQPQVASVITIMLSEKFKARINALPGYDATLSGSVYTTDSIASKLKL